jgi:ribosomal protein S2
MRTISKNVISVCGHIGTHKFNWQPESERFAIGYRSNIIIYNLASTTFYINRATKFVEKLIMKFGRIYFYGLDTYKDKKYVQKYFEINQVVAHKKWKGGFVTNVRNFKTKIKNAKKRFAAVVSFGYNYQNYSLAREAFLVGLPSVSVVDSNVKAENFNYPIPINSDNFAITRMLAYVFGLHIFKGISKRIISRFSKKRKIVKVKKRRKKRRLFKLYFRGKKKLNPKLVIKFNIKIKRFKKRAKWYIIAERLYSKYVKNKKSRLIRAGLFALGFPIEKPWQKSKKKWFEKRKRIIKKKRRGGKRRKFRRKKFKFYKKKWRNWRKRRKIWIKRRKNISNFKKLRNKIRKLYKINKFKKKFNKLIETNPRAIIKNFRITIKFYQYSSFVNYLYRIKKKYLISEKLDKLKKKKIKKSKPKIKKHRYYYHNFNYYKKKKKKKSFFFNL